MCEDNAEQRLRKNIWGNVKKCKHFEAETWSRAEIWGVSFSQKTESANPAKAELKFEA